MAMTERDSSLMTAQRQKKNEEKQLFTGRRFASFLYFFVLVEQRAKKKPLHLINKSATVQMVACFAIYFLNPLEEEV